MRKMFHQDQDDDDDKRLTQTKKKPNIDELDVGGNGQFRRDRLVKCVHDQHRCDRDRNTGFEVLWLEIYCALEMKCNQIY